MIRILRLLQTIGKLRMRKLILLILALFFSGCGNSDQPLVPKSSDGRFLVKTTIESDLLVVNIYSQNKLLHSINTTASVYQKFAIGWHSQEPVLVLNSSDIGVKAWSAENGFKAEFNSQTYQANGNWLYQKKYGK